MSQSKKTVRKVSDYFAEQGLTTRESYQQFKNDMMDRAIDPNPFD